ncbi:MAG TPA: hypothetical protein VFK43_23170, partial [Acidimicrobiales bacterium]|nr:hypothetical protein [Acidimicrobiales bacterium]
MTNATNATSPVAVGEPSQQPAGPGGLHVVIVGAGVGGLGAALAWAFAAVAASRSTRIVGPASALGWGML